MEQQAPNARFILVTAHVSRVIRALRSRCVAVRLQRPSLEEAKQVLGVTDLPATHERERGHLARCIAASYPLHHFRHHWDRSWSPVLSRIRDMRAKRPLKGSPREFWAGVLQVAHHALNDAVKQYGVPVEDLWREFLWTVRELSPHPWDETQRVGMFLHQSEGVQPLLRVEWGMVHVIARAAAS
jgi:hypothetical protein